MPEAKVHELNGKPPSDALIKRMGERHMLAMRLGPGKHLVSRHSVILPLPSVVFRPISLPVSSFSINAADTIVRLIQHGLVLPGGMKGEDYDYMAELVVTQEIARIAARGYQDGLSAGMWIGLSQYSPSSIIIRCGTDSTSIAPILNYGTEKQKAQYIPPILRGDKKICLAISEPFAGSDVSGLLTTAVLTADKKVRFRVLLCACNELS